MARQSRLDLPNIAQHVVQRGNNRLPCFLDDSDRRHHLLYSVKLERGDPLLSPHPAYARLGATDADRAAVYRSLLREALPDEDLQAIRDYLQQQRAWGRDDFRAMVEAKIQRFAGIRTAHRSRSDTAARQVNLTPLSPLNTSFYLIPIHLNPLGVKSRDHLLLAYDGRMK